MPCLATALLAACRAETAVEKAASDARAVAEVEAAQRIKPPVQPILPQSVPVTVREVFRLGEEGCEFRTETGPGVEPLLVAGRHKAVLRIDGEPAILAADSGSPELPFGAHEKYTGRMHSVLLTQEPDGGEASLTLRDRYDRVVYSATGVLACAARFAR